MTRDPYLWKWAKRLAATPDAEAVADSLVRIVRRCIHRHDQGTLKKTLADNLKLDAERRESFKRADELRAEVARLGALFQQEFGCHHSHVEEVRVLSEKLRVALSERDAARERRNAAETGWLRLVTIVDEAFGLQPVQPIDATLSFLERELSRLLDTKAMVSSAVSPHLANRIKELDTELATLRAEVERVCLNHPNRISLDPLRALIGRPR